jgi:hypothetical protein
VKARLGVRPAAIPGPSPRPPAARQSPHGHTAEPDRSERLTLIEFVWVETAGAQPVLFVAREFLH